MQGFKTAAYGLAVTLSGAAITYLEDLKKMLGECGIDPATNAEICGLPSWILMPVGIAIIVLRAVTTTSIFNKK